MKMWLLEKRIGAYVYCAVVFNKECLESSFLERGYTIKGVYQIELLEGEAELPKYITEEY